MDGMDRSAGSIMSISSIPSKIRLKIFCCEEPQMRAVNRVIPQPYGA